MTDFEAIIGEDGEGSYDKDAEDTKDDGQGEEIETVVVIMADEGDAEDEDAEDEDGEWSFEALLLEAANTPGLRLMAVRALIFEDNGVDFFVYDILMSSFDGFDEVGMGFLIKLGGASVIDGFEIAIIDGFMTDHAGLEWTAIFGAAFALEAIGDVCVLDASVFVINSCCHLDFLFIGYILQPWGGFGNN